MGVGLVHVRLVVFRDQGCLRLKWTVELIVCEIRVAVNCVSGSLAEVRGGTSWVGLRKSTSSPLGAQGGHRGRRGTPKLGNRLRETPPSNSRRGNREVTTIEA